MYKNRVIARLAKELEMKEYIVMKHGVVLGRTEDPAIADEIARVHCGEVTRG